jgi:hypothetical protein
MINSVNRLRPECKAANTEVDAGIAARVVNLRVVRGQLAALELLDQAEVILDLDEILAELEISKHAGEMLGLLIVTNGFFEAGHFDYDPWSQAVLAFIAHNTDEEPLDVVAVAMSRPDRFGTRKRQAGLLGESFLRSGSHDPCPLFRNPLEWLQHNGDGVCVLDPILAAPLIAAAKCDLIAPDLEHGRRVLQSGAVPAQKLLIPGQRRAA